VRHSRRMIDLEDFRPTHYGSGNSTDKASYRQHVTIHSQKKKGTKVVTGLYLFKRYTFVPKGCILVPKWYILAPKMYILS